jgi:hypothetical protein
MKHTATTDIVILGGGIAGLWLLNSAIKKGYSAILLETNSLGGGQTIKSQGIIHGGTKYALQGSQTKASQSIAQMPAVWQACLDGVGELDLSAVPVLSDHQYLFSTNKFTGKLAGFFAGLALQGKVEALSIDHYPEVFKSKQFKGVVYALNEIAVDVQAVLTQLAKPHSIYKIASLSPLTVNEQGALKPINIVSDQGEMVCLQAQEYIFTAGSGNELLLPIQKPNIVTMQRRPLRMVLVKTDFSFPVFAHCLGLSGVPRVTITTHKALDGKYVWYLGGQIAEEGVNKTSDEQVAFAKKELAILFPWLDFSKAEATSFLVDRAEPLQAAGKRPDTCFFQEIQNTLIAWPTKLALAPKLSQEIMKHLEAQITAQAFDHSALQGFSKPAVAQPIWDSLL